MTFPQIIESLRCPSCNKFVKAHIISTEIIKKNIKGIELKKVAELPRHKTGGLFSLNCEKSGKECIVSSWESNKKLKTIRCKYCKNWVDAIILHSNTRRSRVTRDVEKKSMFTKMKILYHEGKDKKCMGSGRIFTKLSTDFIDNGHP